jgi:hypothetical protein
VIKLSRRPQAYHLAILPLTQLSVAPRPGSAKMANALLEEGIVGLASMLLDDRTKSF